MENLNLLADTAVRLLQDLISFDPVTSQFGSIPRKKRTFGRRIPANPFAEPKRQYLLPEKSLNSKRKFNADGKQSKIRAKKIKKSTMVRLPAPVAVRERIEARGRSEIKLVIGKRLTSSDLNSGQNRLLMPKLKVADSFLDGEEKSKMKAGMAVKVIEPCGKESEMKLKIWKIRKSLNCVLITGSGLNKASWNEVAGRKENEELGVFEQGNWIRVWSFRDIKGKLCLEIEKVEDDWENFASVEIEPH